MGRRDRDNSSWFEPRRFGPVLAVATAGLALSGLPALAQHTSGPAGGSAGHISAQSYGVPMGGHQGRNPGGHVFAARPMAPGHAVGAPNRGGQPFGTLHGNSFGTGTMHANSFGLASPPPQSWELPRTVVQHWETSQHPHPAECCAGQSDSPPRTWIWRGICGASLLRRSHGIRECRGRSGGRYGAAGSAQRSRAS